MANLGNVSTLNINGNELTIKDAALTEIVNEIIEAIGANNNNIAERINNLHDRSFDAEIKISSVNESEIANIIDGLYKLQYVTITGEGTEATETLNNSAILIQKGTNQYLIKDGQILSRTKTDNTWGRWVSQITLELSSEYEMSSASNDDLELEAGDTYEEAFGKLEKAIIDNELIAATALNDLNDKIENLPPHVKPDWNATAGSSAEILNKPTIPTTSTTITENDSNPVSGGAVYSKFADLIGSAPAALDTLQEIATALNNDANLAGTLTTQISSKIPKVSNPTANNFASFNSDGTIKDSGVSASSFITSETQPDWEEDDTTSAAYIQNKPTIKDELSSEYEMSSESNHDLALEAGDTYEEAFGKIEKTIYDNEYVISAALTDLNNKFDNIHEGDENIIETVKVNGTALTPDANKAVNITIPTAQLSSNYATSTSTNEDLELASGDTYEQAFGKLEKAILDNELVVTNAITDLDARILDTESLATVATSGSYNDLSNKPTIPSAVTESTVSGWGFTKNGGTVNSITINATSPITIDDSAAITSSGTRTISHENSGVSAGTYKSVTVDAKGHVTGGTNPTTLSGYGITDAVTLNTEQTITGNKKFSNSKLEIDNGEFKFNHHIERRFGGLTNNGNYADWDSEKKDGTWHRIWRISFPEGSNFWGKLTIGFCGTWSSFNASGYIEKEICIAFNGSTLYNNVGRYSALGLNVEKDFRISELIWNSETNQWQILIYSHQPSGNNSPQEVIIKCETTNSAVSITAFEGITVSNAEISQISSYVNPKATVDGASKTFYFADLPVYQDPYGEEIAVISDIPTKISELNNDIFVDLVKENNTYNFYNSNNNNIAITDIKSNYNKYIIKYGDSIYYPVYADSSNRLEKIYYITLDGDLNYNLISIDTSTDNIEEGSWDKSPLIIEANNDYDTVPNGTYNIIGTAIDDRREVILKVCYDSEWQRYTYASLTEDDSNDNNYYRFSNDEWTFSIYRNNTFSGGTHNYANSNHTHGNITQYGEITSDTAIENGDKIVIIDINDGNTEDPAYNRISRSTITFDGSTTTTALTPKGTWEPFLKTAPVTSVNGQTGAVSLAIPSAPGTLDTTATTAQSTSSSEALSGNITLHKVAKTGTYNDLIGKPTIPSAPGTLDTTATTAQSTSSSEALSGNITLHKVAKTGTYNDLVGKPTIPSAPGTLNTTATTAQSTSSSEALSGNITLHKVAKTGTYNDLIGKIPITITNYTNYRVGEGGIVKLIDSPDDDSGNEIWACCSESGGEFYNAGEVHLSEYTYIGETLYSPVTESTVSGWGFTKNTGTVSSLSDLGITATATELNYTDGVTSNIQTQLNAKGTYSKPSGGIPKTDLASAVQTSLGKADTALQSYTETDPTVPSHVKSITTTDISNWNNKLSTAPVTSVNGQTGAVNLTIPTVSDSTVTITMNGNTVGTFTLNKSGNTTIDLGTVLTSHQSIKTVNSQSLTGTGNISINELPTVTSSDNGKVLMVVNGAWALVNPVTLYSGSGTPSNAQGNNGDLYVQS